MRLDLFLSTLLLGVTLLTCAVAVGHLLGGAFLGPPLARPSRTRAWLRASLAASFVTACLLLFLEPSYVPRFAAQEPWWGLFSPPVASFGPATPRRLVRDVPQASDAPTNSTPDTPLQSGAMLPARTRTLFVQRTLEDRSVRQNFSVALESHEFSARSEARTRRRSANPQVVALTAAVTGDLVGDLARDSKAGLQGVSGIPNGQEGCRGWLDDFHASHKPGRGGTGRGVLEVTRLPVTLSPEAVVFVCASHPILDAEWRRLEAHVNAGGSLLMVGRPLPSTVPSALMPLFGVDRWVEASAWDKPIAIALGGGRLAFGGFPSGLRMHFGMEWQKATGAPLAFVGSESDAPATVLNEALLAPENGKLSALIMREHGKGRVVWTSLPARLYGRNRYLYSDEWDALHGRIEGFLRFKPLVGIEPWPEQAQNPVVVAFDAGIGLEHVQDLLPLLEATQAKATFFVTQAQAAASPELVAALAAAGHELALRNTQTNFDSTETSKAGESHGLQSTQALLEAWSARFACCRNGLLTTPGEAAGADTFGALVHGPLSYAFGDPFGDRLSPFVMTAEPTRRLQDHLAHADGLNGFGAKAQNRQVGVVPVLTQDDLSLAKGGDAEAFLKTALDEFKLTQKLGGPTVFRFHAHVLGAPAHRTVLSALLKNLSQAGAHFGTATDLVAWANARGALEVTLSAKGANSRPGFVVKNSGEKSVEGAVLRVTEPVRWAEYSVKLGSIKSDSIKPDASGQTRLRVPKLDPGASVRFEVNP